MTKGEATYQVIDEKSGRGMFFRTDCCGNIMYSTSTNPLFYHGKLCPKCMWGGKRVVLYLRGSEKANEIMVKRGII